MKDWTGKQQTATLEISLSARKPAPTRRLGFWADLLLGRGGGKTCLKMRLPPFHTSLEARATAETEKERVVGAGITASYPSYSVQGTQDDVEDGDCPGNGENGIRRRRVSKDLP